jgi:hypothetical protein
MKNLINNNLLAFNNPVIGKTLGNSPKEAADGVTFVKYFVDIWNAFITVGAIMVLINFLWGAFEWISAGGDSSKVEKGRNRITQSMIGLLILVSSFVIIGFVSDLFFGDDFNILQLKFNEPGGAQGEPANSGSSATEPAASINFFAPPIAYALELDIGGTAERADVPGTADYNPEDGEAGFGVLITKILTISSVIGALMVLLNLIWGGIEWITSGGDKGKAESARNRITQSIIGLIVLASVVALFMLIQEFLDLEVLVIN